MSSSAKNHWQETLRQRRADPCSHWYKPHEGSYAKTDPREKRLIEKRRTGEYKDLPIGQEDFHASVRDRQITNLIRIVPRPKS